VCQWSVLGLFVIVRQVMENAGIALLSQTEALASDTDGGREAEQAVQDRGGEDLIQQLLWALVLRELPLRSV
jgi:hypothetical protein